MITGLGFVTGELEVDSNGVPESQVSVPGASFLSPVHDKSWHYRAGTNHHHRETWRA